MDAHGRQPEGCQLDPFLAPALAMPCQREANVGDREPGGWKGRYRATKLGSEGAPGTQESLPWPRGGARQQFASNSKTVCMSKKNKQSVRRRDSPVESQGEFSAHMRY